MKMQLVRLYEKLTAFPLFDFRRFLAPQIVKVLYFIFLVLAEWTSISGFVRALRYGSYWLAVTGLIWICLIPFVLRIPADVILVLFGIYDRLGQKGQGGDQDTVDGKE